MKWLVALLAVVAVATAGVVVYVVLEERDTVPNDLRACAIDDVGARRIAGIETMGPMRLDLLDGRLAEGDTVTLRNGYRVTELRPAGGDYVTIVVKRPDQFELPTIATVEQEPSRYPLVAMAQGPAADRLLACVDAQR